MKKEEFFEVLGELDDDIVRGAKINMKKSLNLRFLASMAACVALVAVFGVTMLKGGLTPSTVTPPASAKPVINFEGVVSSVEDGRVVLNDGTIVLITEDTVFATDLISQDILAGNFIQGYTADNENAAEITANKIWTNEGRSGSAKRVINFEGRVTKVEDKRIFLDNGKIVQLSESSNISAPDGSEAEITVGIYIQGYAENAESEVIDAKFILITPL